MKVRAGGIEKIMLTDAFVYDDLGLNIEMKVGVELLKRLKTRVHYIRNSILVQFKQ